LRIVRARGRVTRFDGSAVTLGPDEFVATNGAIHDELMAALREPVEGAEAALA
jgi:fructose-1,6-bisphosphatase/inositol monophosphatase family enzyme